jgi:flagellar motor switch protein FliM
MADDSDQIDQDAIAAQWEASLDSEDPAEAAKSAAANELTEAMAEQWSAKAMFLLSISDNINSQKPLFS